MMSSDSSAAAVFMNGGEVISCQNTPEVVVGGELQLSTQRLWLLTPFTQLLPGSVAELASLSANSAPAQPRIQGPPLDPPVRSLPMIFETCPPAVKSCVYHSVDAVVISRLPLNGDACG